MAQVDATGAPPRRVFGAYDIRGIVNDEITAAHAYHIGRAFGALIHGGDQRKVIVGYDGRRSSPELASALREGLLRSGLKVTDIGRVPTPALYFSVDVLDARNGVMVTASHNPAAYNGFKFIYDGLPLTAESILGLCRAIEQRDYVDGIGSETRADITDAYLSRVCGARRYASWNAIAVDGANGVAGPYLVAALRRVGIRAEPLFCGVDGRFPNHPPDPTDPANLQALRTSVLRHKLPLGLALDGDGDRLGAVDENGVIVWPDELLILFARDVLSRSPGTTVVYDVKSTSSLEKEILSAGGTPLMWQSGHSRMRRKMAETKAVLGGEFSGHFFFQDQWLGFDDGVYAALRLVDLLERSGTTLGALRATLPPRTSTPELRLPLGEQDSRELLRAVDESEFGKDALRRITLDGLRLEFADGWILVRHSNTMPYLTFRFESSTPDGLLRLEQQLATTIHGVAPQLRLPFGEETRPG